MESFEVKMSRMAHEQRVRNVLNKESDYVTKAELEQLLSEHDEMLVGKVVDQLQPMLEGGTPPFEPLQIRTPPPVEYIVDHAQVFPEGRASEPTPITRVTPKITKLGGKGKRISLGVLGAYLALLVYINISYFNGWLPSWLYPGAPLPLGFGTVAGLSAIWTVIFVFGGLAIALATFIVLAILAIYDWVRYG